MILVVLLALVCMLAAPAVHSEEPNKPENSDANKNQPVTGRQVTIETGKGKITIALYEKDAPNTTKNFIELVEKKFYDKLTFHRVENWVVQGGDPTGTGGGGSGKTIKLETSPNLTFDKPYIVGMARSADPDSATSQFFITKKSASLLNGKYAVFGIVTAGEDVVNKLQKGNVMKTIRIVIPPKPAESSDSQTKSSDEKSKTE